MHPQRRPQRLRVPHRHRLHRQRRPLRLPACRQAGAPAAREHWPARRAVGAGWLRAGAARGHRQLRTGALSAATPQWRCDAGTPGWHPTAAEPAAPRRVRSEDGQGRLIRTAHAKPGTACAIAGVQLFRCISSSGNIAGRSSLTTPMLKHLLLPLLLGCSSLALAAELRVHPVDGPADQPVQISVAGLLPSQTVKLQLSMQDSSGNRWLAHANYRADHNGIADTATAGAEAGSYAGVDAMGLFWSMRPEAGKGKPMPLPMHSDADGLRYAPATMQLEAFVDGERIGQQTLLRRINAADVVATPLQLHGV
ncbi:Acyl-CoA thioester hydrolase / Bile acid-CoA amino acid N-acetyltransferase, partial [Necator americanus]